MTDMHGVGPEPESQERPGQDSCDPLLQELVDLANLGGLEASIMLWLPGGLVSGRLVSGAAYFRKMAQIFEEHQVKYLADQFSNDSMLFEKEAKAVESGEGSPGTPPQRIHLLNARTTFGAISLPRDGEGGTPWRGRLSEVAAWALGEVSGS